MTGRRTPTLLGSATIATIAAVVTALAPELDGAWPPPVPSTLTLTVKETAGVARVSEVLRSGVPLPRSLGVTNVSSLAVVDDGGTAVPAEFQILARWDAGLATLSAPIQWVLVAFAATVPASSSATYRLVTDGSIANPLPATPLTLAQAGNQVTVDTGVARFTLGGAAGALFDEVRRGAATLATGGALVAIASGVSRAHPTTRRVFVEHQGPLSAVVVVEGAYDMPAVGGGLLASRRRYTFTAGSPTAIVRHSVAWEGVRCNLQSDEVFCDGAPDGIRLTRVRDTLTLAGTAPRAVTAVGDLEAAALTGSVAAGQDASVRQTLRASRLAPLAFQVSVPGTAGASGSKADGGVLAAAAGTGTLAIALDHMHRYEPQALRLLPEGSLAVDLVDADAWVAARQGLYATLAVSALPAGPSRADLDRLVWGPLNRPLRAWPSASWFASTNAVDEIPVGPLPEGLARYDQLVPAVLARTLALVDDRGLNGLQTFGLWPRYWGNPILSEEIDCGGNDPTPGETFDDLYWCTTWTDYHNAGSSIPAWAMRSGAVEWLDELALPAARRVLHTLILQCAPGDAYFYCGQAPTGYGGYRSNFNSSHAYVDNLVTSYWLTGDGTVVETLRRGASTMRNYYCTRRPAQPCLATDPPTDEFAGFSGRVTAQWNGIFRFVGLASDDASYLEDYKANLARAASQTYVEASQGGASYGFSLFAPAAGAGTYGSDQIWMTALYDMNLFSRLERDTNDAPIGSPPLAPSRIQQAFARTLRQYGANVVGDGTIEGRWPNVLQLTFTGNRVGGALTAVTANIDPNGNGVPCDDDGCLYDTNKAVLAAALVRAGDTSGDAAVTALGEADVLRTMEIAWANGTPIPLGKDQGEYLVRLHAAVARLALAASPCGGPDSTPPVVTPPASLTVRQTTCSGGAGATLATLQTLDPASFASLSGFLAGGSADDACGAVTRLTARLSGADVTPATLFPVGPSTVTFRWQDAAANLGTATATVTVRRQGDVDQSGVVDVFDVVDVQNLIVGNLVAGVAPFTAPRLAADANADGTVDVFDVVLVAGFIVGNVGCLLP